MTHGKRMATFRTNYVAKLAQPKKYAAGHDSEA